MLFKHVRELIEGIKELKTHQCARDAFFDHVIEAEGVFRRRQFIGDSLYDTAVICGRLLFFVAIALLLFVWPRLSTIERETLTRLHFDHLLSDVAAGANYGVVAHDGVGFRLGDKDRTLGLDAQRAASGEQRRGANSPLGAD